MDLLEGESVEIAGVRISVTGVHFREQGNSVRRACVSLDVQPLEPQSEPEAEPTKSGRKRR